MTSEQAKALDGNPLWRAHVEGKQLQWKQSTGWIDWHVFEPITFIEYPDFIRLKPIPVPPGDLTWEEAAKLAKEGKAVEWYCDAYWRPVEGYYLSGRAYRLKPEPKRVPLCESDLPGQPFWIRTDENEPAWVPSITKTHCGGTCYASLAMGTYRYSIDRNLPWAQWQPFYKEI